ncbi:MAG: hypothetical protein HN764_10860 [Gammaproteobacteria bacterium]|nr:hypothetical protein [Gammaproteobacteria bacterium]
MNRSILNGKNCTNRLFNWIPAYAGMTILVILAGVYARRGAGMTVWYKYLLKGK